MKRRTKVILEYRLIDDKTGETINVFEVEGEDELIELEEMAEALGFYIEEVN
jgi:hypothetical protein